jgi:hypothetical protein
MRTIAAWLSLGLAAGGIATQVAAQGSEQKCPVVLDHIDLSYAHQGGESKPQLRVNFDNAADKKIAKVTFSLSVLDPDGYPRPYPEDLAYSDGLEAGKQRIFTWYLAQESVDIHRAGETVVVREVKFSDNTSWKDDGSESCALTVDFHAR